MRDAQADASGGPFPLLIISHGYPGNRYLLSHLAENLLAVCPSRVLAKQPTGLDIDPCLMPGLSYSVPAHFNAILERTGMLTCYPSPTPFGLGLGSA